MRHRVSLLAFALAVNVISGCKARKDGASQVKSEDDIQPGEMQWVGSEKKWAITCREGRLHKGYRSTLIRTEDLAKACEEIDPNSGSGGGGGGGGGVVVVQPGPAGEWDLALKCPNRPEKIKKVNFALGNTWIAELIAMPPALATQQLCTGFVSKFNQILSASDSLFKALTGESNGGAAILVIVEKGGTAVAYDASAFVLTVPWKIDDASIDGIASAMGASVNLCGEKSAYIAKACWYPTLTKAESCIQACARIVKSYDTRTASLAGEPGGTNENCAAIAAQFGQGFGGQNQNCEQAQGCGYIVNGAKAFRCVGKNTTGDATGGQYFSDPAGQSGAWQDALRYCACK